ncbi:MAG TPA: hypothetical protein VGA89_00325 [Patescibacteria group bacterium]|jgi:TRAP-type C4-dicarboxylate transport system permease small subunit
MSKLLAQNTIDLTSAARKVDLPGSGKSNGFGNFMSGLMSGVMVLAALVTFLYLIWGALEWITSAGDKGKLESARNKISQALVGLIVLATTTALFILLQRFLGICVLNFGGTC